MTDDNDGEVLQSQFYAMRKLGMPADLAANLVQAPSYPEQSGSGGSSQQNITPLRPVQSAHSSEVNVLPGWKVGLYAKEKKDIGKPLSGREPEPLPPGEGDVQLALPKTRQISSSASKLNQKKLPGWQQRSKNQNRVNKRNRGNKNKKQKGNTTQAAPQVVNVTDSLWDAVTSMSTHVVQPNLALGQARVNPRRPLSGSGRSNQAIPDHGKDPRRSKDGSSSGDRSRKRSRFEDLNHGIQISKKGRGRSPERNRQDKDRKDEQKRMEMGGYQESTMSGGYQESTMSGGMELWNRSQNQHLYSQQAFRQGGQTLQPNQGSWSEQMQWERTNQDQPTRNQAGQQSQQQQHLLQREQAYQMQSGSRDYQAADASVQQMGAGMTHAGGSGQVNQSHRLPADRIRSPERVSTANKIPDLLGTEAIPTPDFLDKIERDTKRNRQTKTSYTKAKTHTSQSSRSNSVQEEQDLTPSRSRGVRKVHQGKAPRNLYCSFCKLTCTTPLMYRAHCMSSQHLTRLRQNKPAMDVKQMETLQTNLRKVQRTILGAVKKTVATPISEKPKPVPLSSPTLDQVCTVDPSQSIAEYTSRQAFGTEFILPVTGFYCKVCSKFFNTREHAYSIHCKTNKHITKAVTRIKHNALQDKLQAAKAAKQQGVLVKLVVKDLSKRTGESEKPHTSDNTSRGVDRSPGRLEDRAGGWVKHDVSEFPKLKGNNQEFLARELERQSHKDGVGRTLSEERDRWNQDPWVLNKKDNERDVSSERRYREEEERRHNLEREKRMMEEEKRDEEMQRRKISADKYREEQIWEDRLREDTLKQKKIRKESIMENKLREDRLREELLREETMKLQRLREEERRQEERLREEKLGEERLGEERLDEEKLREEEQRLQEEQLRLQEEQLRLQEELRKEREEQLREEELVRERMLMAQQYLQEEKLREEQLLTEQLREERLIEERLLQENIIEEQRVQEQLRMIQEEEQWVIKKRRTLAWKVRQEQQWTSTNRGRRKQSGRGLSTTSGAARRKHSEAARRRRAGIEARIPDQKRQAASSAGYSYSRGNQDQSKSNSQERSRTHEHGNMSLRRSPPGQLSAQSEQQTRNIAPPRKKNPSDVESLEGDIGDEDFADLGEGFIIDEIVG